jgi:hypothetical protein
MHWIEIRSHHHKQSHPSHHVTPLPATSQGTTDRPAHTRPPLPLDRHNTATNSIAISQNTNSDRREKVTAPPVSSQRTQATATSHPSAPSRCVGTADGNTTHHTTHVVPLLCVGVHTVREIIARAVRLGAAGRWGGAPRLVGWSAVQCNLPRFPFCDI